MKQFGFVNSLPIDEELSLYEIETPTPKPTGHDLLVEIRATSINPADAKRRRLTALDKPHDEPMVVGYDAVGVVLDVGSDTSIFKKGNEVWYAGDANRPGTHADVQLVDERVVGPKPKNLTNAEAAAMPLTGLTAWEMLFERFGIKEGDGEGKTLLVIGAAGGVGSLTIQLARKLTKLKVIATASRPETIAWCKEMGAHEVVDHRNLVEAMKSKGLEDIDYITQYADLSQHWNAMCELVKPQGKIGTIVETNDLIDISMLQGKSVSLHWELMFTRTIFQTEDMAEQNVILTRLSKLVDDGVIRSTLQQTIQGFSLENFKEAHRRIEKANVIGKLVIEY